MTADSRYIVKTCCKNLMAIPYHTNINENQRAMLRLIFPGACARFRRHDPFGILEAILFIVYTGCRWSRLPMGYPPCKTVNHHYRSWSARGYLGKALRTLVLMKRHKSGLPLFPTLTVIDSRSVRTGLPHAVYGVDGGKRVKGIRRHLAVDENGYPLGIPESGCIRWTTVRNLRAIMRDDMQ